VIPTKSATVIKDGINMRVEIATQDNGYYWCIYDGPDGVDFADGFCVTLGECFEQIVRERLLIGMSY
jgi:hypothetical protein